jgi:DNA-directed RNA polymerase subunit RPC12/RpoP
MRYQCHECDKRFEEPDFIVEKHGLETPPYEKIAVCPYCKGYFEAMYECKICGEWFTDEELTMGVCDECIYQHDTDIELLYKLGNEEEAKETVTLNGFVASVLTEEQINEILIRELRTINYACYVNGTEFIGSDKSWFAEQLIKEKQNAEKF